MLKRTKLSSWLSSLSLKRLSQMCQAGCRRYIWPSKYFHPMWLHFALLIRKIRITAETLVIPCVTAFLYYVLLFSLHTRHGMTIWVHLVWKDLSVCWITTWNLIPSCLHVELPNNVAIFIDRHHWLYFFFSVISNNLIHLKWCEAIISYTLTHQLNWHFQALLTVLSNTSWLTHCCCIKCHSRDHCCASNI